MIEIKYKEGKPVIVAGSYDLINEYNCEAYNESLRSTNDHELVTCPYLLHEMTEEELLSPNARSTKCDPKTCPILKEEHLRSEAEIRKYMEKSLEGHKEYCKYEISRLKSREKDYKKEIADLEKEITENREKIKENEREIKKTAQELPQVASMQIEYDAEGRIKELLERAGRL